MYDHGFGFVEIGTVTPKPQDGNPKKRIFIGYLLIAVFIAAFWLVYFRKLNLREAINKIFDKSNETKIHKASFVKIKKKFKKKYPKLKNELKLISLNKKIENF